MPRIELIPPGWEGSIEQKQGDGTPTIDVCRECSAEFREGAEAPEILLDILPEYEGCIVGERDVEHPPFDDCEYECEICGCHLRNRDDWNIW